MVILFCEICRETFLDLLHKTPFYIPSPYHSKNEMKKNLNYTLSIVNKTPFVCHESTLNPLKKLNPKTGPAKSCNTTKFLTQAFLFDKLATDREKPSTESSYIHVFCLFDCFSIFLFI